MNPNTPQSGKGGTTPASGQSKTTSTTPTAASPVTGSASASATSGAAASGSSTMGASGADVAQKAQSLVDTVKQQASSQINAQKQRATEGLGSVVSAVRQTSERLRENRQPGVAQYVERAADQIERFSAHLRDRDIDELMNEARELARRQPALFVGTSFAAGLVAARFFKASSPARHAERPSGVYGGSTAGGYGSGSGVYVGGTSGGFATGDATSGERTTGGTGSAGGPGTSTRPRGFEGGF